MQSARIRGGSRRKPQSPKYWVIAAVAGVICLIVAAGLWLSSVMHPAVTSSAAVLPSSQSAPTTHTFTPPQYAADRPKQVTGEAESLFTKAMNDYKKANYSGASVTLRQATTFAPEAPELRFYLGVCYMMTNDLNAGVNELKTAVALGASPYLDEARYTLAEAYYKKHDGFNAARELKAVIESNSPLAPRAQALFDMVSVQGQPNY